MGKMLTWGMYAVEPLTHTKRINGRPRELSCRISTAMGSLKTAVSS